MKRSNGEKPDHSQSHKKQKHDYSDRKQSQSYGYSSSQQAYLSSGREHNHKKQPSNKDAPSSNISHADALNQLPVPISLPGAVPGYIPFTVPKDLPALPPIQDPSLTKSPFTHRSMLANYNRAIQATPDITYERLEFLGDAYIELIASRLLFSRFGHLNSGQQSQLRELLVKNETLAEYSRAYGFENKVEADDLNSMLNSVHESSRQKGNKGFNKILGDVFEAYVAAVILSDPEDGFAVAEKWLTALWAPKLLSSIRTDPLTLTHSSTADLRTVYNPSAKNELQQRIAEHAATKLEYEAYQASVELKGDQMGQNRHFIALYLTGWGYERRLLGKGEGRSKVEAGNWAAVEAMYGETRELVEECDEKLKVKKAEKKKAQADGGK